MYRTLDFEDVGLHVLGAPKGAILAAGLSGTCQIDAEGYPSNIVLETLVRAPGGAHRIEKVKLSMEDALYPRVVAGILASCADEIQDIISDDDGDTGEHRIGKFEALGRR
jgi:hypothetical protein